MKKTIAFSLKLFFSFGIITFIIYNYINVDDFIKTVQDINYSILPFVFILIYVTRILIAYQTKISFTPFNINTNTYSIFRIHFISSFYSLVLPSDLAASGVTWYLLSKENNRRAEVASVIVYLRILNLITLLPFALLGIYLEPKIREYNVHFYVLALGFLLFIIFLPLFWYKIALIMESFFNALIRLIPLNKISKRLLEANMNVWNSVKTIRKMPIRFFVNIIILSVIFQLLTIVSTYFVLEMVNIHLSLSVSAWLTALLTIIAFIPLTISGIGLRDLSLIYVLQEFYLISPESSLLLSTVILLITVFFCGFFGGYYAVTFGKK
ncbi:conserved hypothetical protein, membrane [Beggiatoa sp. PS]|nr:conserved hypothetical protein, membrane [Beggiatoa sp. PS]